MISKLTSPIVTLPAPSAAPSSAPTEQPQLPEIPIDGLDIAEESSITPAKWALLGVGTLSVFAPMAQAQAAPQAQIQIRTQRHEGEQTPQAQAPLHHEAAQAPAAPAVPQAPAHAGLHHGHRHHKGRHHGHRSHIHRAHQLTHQHQQPVQPPQYRVEQPPQQVAQHTEHRSSQTQASRHGYGRSYQGKEARREFERLARAYREVTAEMEAEKAADAAIPRVAPEPQATYVLPGSGRLELFKPSQVVSNYTDTAVDLGHGILLDSNGTLSLLLQSGSEVKEFKTLENDNGAGVTTHLTRDGETLRAEGSTGKRVNIEHKGNSTTIRSHDNFYAISGGTGGPSTFIVGRQGTEQLQYRIDWKGNEATITLPNHQHVVVNVDGQLARVANGSGTKDYAIMPRHVIPQDSQITVDQKFRVSNNNQELQAFKDRLEAAEPGFVKSHPLTMAVVEYTMKNADFAELVKAKKSLTPLEVAVPAASALTGVEVGLALTQQAEALGLGAKAMALKGQAMGIAQQAYAAKAAAEAALKAGNIPQAMQLGHQAQVLGGQAQAIGGQAKGVGAQAMQIGEHAKHAAHVAKTASIVGGSLAIVDGLITGYQGFKEIDTVKGALQAVSARYQQIAEEENSESFQLAKADYERVTPELLKLARHADTTLTIGGVKVGCGALTLGSAFMSGPVAPVVAGAVGSACYLGTAIYDHYRD